MKTNAFMGSWQCLPARSVQSKCLKLCIDSTRRKEVPNLFSNVSMPTEKGKTSLYIVFFLKFFFLFLSKSSTANNQYPEQL